MLPAGWINQPDVSVASMDGLINKMQMLPNQPDVSVASMDGLINKICVACTDGLINQM